MKDVVKWGGLGVLFVYVLGGFISLCDMKGDSFICDSAFSTGLTPSTVVICYALLFLLIALFFFILAKKNENFRYKIPGALFGLGSVVILGFWIAQGLKLRYYRLSERQFVELQIRYSEKDGYSYIGEVSGSSKWGQRDFLLYSKIIDGKRHFYCGEKDTDIDIKKKYLVQKYKSHYGKVADWSDTYYYIKDYEFDWDNTEDESTGTGTRRVSQDAIDRAVDEINSHREDESKIVVEHQRSQQPVNVWQSCGICLGSGNCTVCGGNGWIYSARASDGRGDCYNCRDGRCPACGGERGRYVVEYR